MRETIGFIGLGQMGSAMATNLLAAGFSLRVYNRTPEKAKPLVQRGAALCTSAAKVAARGGVVITMLADDHAVESVATDELAAALGAGGVHLSMSTVLPATNERLAELHRKHGATLITSPVFGRPEAAAERKLWICTSGPADAKQRVKPILDAMGQGIFDFGEKIGSANVVKLAGNFMLVAAVEAMAEASALAEKSGVPREQLLGMLTKTLFNCAIYNGYGRKIIDADFQKVAFALPLALKDMRLAHQVADASSVPMPLLSLVHDRYVALIANGKQKLDSSALALGAAGDAGLKW